MNTVYSIHTPLHIMFNIKFYNIKPINIPSCVPLSLEIIHFYFLLYPTTSNPKINYEIVLKIALMHKYTKCEYINIYVFVYASLFCHNKPLQKNLI